MEYVYLGLFQKVFNWVLQNILAPVFRFVSNLLTTVLTWVFQNILAPILLPVLETALNTLIDLWKTLYSTQLYLLFSGVLKLIDYLEKAFDVFIGLENVTYIDENGVEIAGSLVEVLMQQKTISTVFWMLTLGALGLALILTIYATAKSAFDLDFENKRPVSKVLAAMMKTFVQFFTVPFFVYFFLKLSAVILQSVTSVLSFGEETTLGRIVFTIASLNASKNGINLSDGNTEIALGTTAEDTVRYPFYSTSVAGAKDYGNLKQVGDSFNLAEFDYVIGFIAAVFLLFTIGICLIVFVQRIFELVMLYIASPYFVCMIPLDDGERFSRWREMFIAKCFTGFGSAIGMRLFLMICPLVMGNKITFGEHASTEMNYMMKLFFLAGGAWAVYKSGSMITSLLSSQAGSSEANTAATAGGMLYGYTAGKLISKGQQFMSTALHSRGRGQGGGSGLEGGAGLGGGPGGISRQDGRFQGKPGRSGAVSRAGGLGLQPKTSAASRYGTDFRIRKELKERALGGQDSRRRKVAGALSYAGQRGIGGMMKDGARKGARQVLGSVGPGGTQVSAKDFRIHTALKERALGDEGSRRRKAADVMQYVSQRGAGGVMRDQVRRGAQRMMGGASSSTGAYRGAQTVHGRRIAGGAGSASSGGSRQITAGGCGYTVGITGEVLSRSFPGSILTAEGIRVGGAESLSGFLGDDFGSQSASASSGVSSRSSFSVGSSDAGSGTGEAEGRYGSAGRRYTISSAPIPVASVRLASRSASVSAGSGISSGGSSSAGSASSAQSRFAGGASSSYRGGSAASSAEAKKASYSSLSIRGLQYQGAQSGRTFTRRNSL